METEYKYGQYCTPLIQSDCRCFFRLSDNAQYLNLCYRELGQFCSDYSSSNLSCYGSASLLFSKQGPCA